MHSFSRLCKILPNLTFFSVKNRRQRGHFHGKLASPQQNLSLTLEILLWLSSDEPDETAILPICHILLILFEVFEIVLSIFEMILHTLYGHM